MSDSDQLFDEMAADIAESLDRVGGEIVDAKQKDLSVPVGITRGPRGGKILIHSKEGESPRRITGKLQEGMAYRVERDGLSVSLIIDDPVVYAAPLQGKQRIVTSDVVDRFTDSVIQAFADGVGGEVSE